MSNVIPFTISDQQLSGMAQCLGCQHKWAAVAPVGSVWLECPSCSTEKGRYISHAERLEDHWECDCGNDLFHATRNGVYCPNCGVWQVFT